MAMQKTLLAVFALFLAIPGAAARETDWIEIAPDARVRLISNDRLAGDTTLVGLEIDMPDTTETYWRIPGESGIPTIIDIAGSEGIASHDIVWPLPIRQSKDGFTDQVYRGHTVLPVQLTLAGDSGSLAASVVMGVCSDICVPVRAAFSMDLDFSHPDLGQDLRLKQALALAPMPWTEADAPIGDVRFDPGTGRLDVAVNTQIVDPAALIVDNGDPAILFSMPQKSPEPGIFSYQLLGGGEKRDLRGKPLRFTFQTADGAFDLSRVPQ
jgi:DsbC/DsbD-like thiol-disulfide interchange protein